MLKNLFVRLWNDEAGAIIATEYLMLGSIVVAGAAAGMGSMRDSVVDEYKEFGQTVRDVRQSYSTPVNHGGVGKAGGTNVTNMPNSAPATPNSQGVTFACPVP
jgi:hypothetical protein